MKKLIFKTPIMAVCLFLSLVACEPESDQDMAILESLPTDDAPVVDRTSETFTVANIQKDGHEFRFIVDGKNVDIIEKLPENMVNIPGFLEENEESTPFDIFVALTEDHVLVPASIAHTAEGNALINSKRKIDYTNQFVEIKSGIYSAEKTLACGDVGAEVFYDKYCLPPVVSTANNMEYCDNTTWLSLIRSSVFGGSWKKVKRVTTRTNVICGLTRIQLQVWNNGSWELYNQVDFTNGVWVWKQSRTSAEYRRVVRNRPNNSGSFRAFTQFYN